MPPVQATPQSYVPVSPVQGQAPAPAWAPAYTPPPYLPAPPAGAATTAAGGPSGLTSKVRGHARGLPALVRASTANKVLAVAMAMGIIGALLLLFGPLGSYSSSTTTSSSNRHYNGYTDTYYYTTDYSTSWSDTTLTIASAQFGLSGLLSIIALLAGVFLVYRSMLTDDPVSKWKYLRRGFLLPIVAIVVMFVTGAAFASWADSQEYDEIGIEAGLGWGVIFSILQMVLVLGASTRIPRPADVRPLLHPAIMAPVERATSMVRQGSRSALNQSKPELMAPQGMQMQSGGPVSSGPMGAPYYPPIGTAPPPYGYPPQGGPQR